MLKCNVSIRSDLRQLALNLLACVPEDLNGSLCHLIILHFETLQKRLVRLSGVKGCWVGERQNLRARDKLWYKTCTYH